MSRDSAKRAQARSALITADVSELGGLGEALDDEWESFVEDFGYRVTPEELRYAADLREAWFWLWEPRGDSVEEQRREPVRRSPQAIASLALANQIPTTVVVVLAGLLEDIREMEKDNG